MTTIINVTPQSRNGTEVDCDFSGPDVTGNAIFLNLAKAYDLTFNLVSGPGGSYTFDDKKPFCNQANRCPPAPPAGSAHTPCSVTSKSSSSITVHVDPVPSKTVTHYRLNFNDGSSCDPIIVHD